MQITRFGRPEVLDVVDLPDPEPGPGEELFEVSAAGIDYADTHQRLSWEVRQRDRTLESSRRSGFADEPEWDGCP